MRVPYFSGDEIKTGDLVSFRYKGLKVHDPAPMVLVIAPLYENCMHGLNARYLSPMHYSQMMWFFKTPEQRAQLQNPFLKEIETIRRNAEQRWVAEQSSPSQPVSAIVPAQGMGGKNAFGGINTFKRTAAQVRQVHQTFLQGHRRREVAAGRSAIPIVTPEEAQEMMMTFDSMVEIEEMMGTYNPGTTPYLFYHQWVKQLLRPNTHRCYRKYNTRGISNMRLVTANTVKQAEIFDIFEGVREGAELLVQQPDEVVSPQQKAAIARKLNKLIGEQWRMAPIKRAREASQRAFARERAKKNKK